MLECVTYECIQDWPEFGTEPTTPRYTWSKVEPWRQMKQFVFSSPVSSPISLRSEALHTVLTTVTVANSPARLAVQIVSAEKPVTTVLTITNVA